VYVLERHISRYFALKPGTKKAGMHRGEGFYHREALAELHTADRFGLHFTLLHTMDRLQLLSKPLLSCTLLTGSVSSPVCCTPWIAVVGYANAGLHTTQIMAVGCANAELRTADKGCS